jgi:flagellar biosynthesis anti-sigma factor FlgM
MDKITNNTFNNIPKDISKNKDKFDNLGKADTIIKSETSDKLVDLNDTKLLASNLGKSAPIDSDKIAKLKAAISAGQYPLDLDKVSDALMQAYRDMKS